ncbi:MAG: MBL fold metallo-hydrolase [Bacteriovoracaceae bacterium]|nr:MBL fold metallo-hydrolase [Bacteriovoracaceae bacterium]
MNTLTVLGSGTSTGVPILGCKCRICQSTNPSNKRLRSSVFLETKNKKNILVDATPDVRTQLLTHNVQRVDAVFITHDHADHTHGIDDLRPYCFHQKSSLPVHCSEETAHSLKRKFDYIFDRHRLYHAERPVIGGGIPELDLQIFHSNQIQIAQEDFTLFSLPHGYVQTSAFKHGSLAYLTDCHSIAEEVVRDLKASSLEWLIIDCVKPGRHDTHMGYEQTRVFLEAIAPQNAGLIHMGHEWDHEELTHTLLKDGFKTARPLKDGDQLRYS